MTTEILQRPLPAADRALAELFEPLTPEQFFETCWDREPLHLSPGPHVARTRWLDTTALMGILTTTGVSAMDVRLARDGTQIDVSEFSSKAWHHDSSSTSVLDPDRVLSFHDQGATILLESLDRYHLPMARRARAIEQRLGCTIKSNAFITPANTYAFPLHNDSHDGLILQLEGRKHWDLYEHPIPLPLRSQRYEPGSDAVGRKIMSVDLEPGDFLYVPRGVIHRVAALGEPSLHITLIPVWYTWHDYLEGLVSSAARDDIELRRAYDGAALDANRLQALLRALEQPGPITRVFDRLREDFVSMRRPLVPERWDDLQAYHTLATDTLVRARPEMVVSLRSDGSPTVELAWLRERLRFPTALEPALRRLLTGEPVRPCELPGDVDPAARLDAAAQLMRAGLVAVEVSP